MQYNLHFGECVFLFAFSFVLFLLTGGQCNYKSTVKREYSLWFCLINTS